MAGGLTIVPPQAAPDAVTVAVMVADTVLTFVRPDKNSRLPASVVSWDEKVKVAGDTKTLLLL